ncbi:Methyltransferase-like protein 5 [Durusdinium trenchii]|uniref:Methyltransferase-like protein 5 n=1 Tax=Durusdinium trenchii TaxID=1381693 RepID=A0ABP0S233_9DINO
MAQNVKYLDAGVYMIHVLTLNVGTAASPVFQETFAIPLMQRRTGALFALPMGAIPDPLLQAGMTASPEDLIGPSTTVTVPVVLEEVDGTEAPTDQDMDVMIVDFHIAVLESVRGFDPVTEGPGIQLFSPSGPDVLPESSSLLLAAYSWLEEGAEGRTQFYSAEEPPPASAAPAKSNPAGRGKTKASPGGASTPKRVTTATLAEQLAELSKNLPAISTRLDAMAERQNKVEALLSAGTAQQSAPTPAYRQNFERPSALRKASPLQFMQDIGSPPRVRALQDKAKPTAVTTMEEDEPELLPCDPDFQVVEASKGDLSAGMPEAIMRQSQALTTLVAHLVGQDSLQDFPSAAFFPLPIPKLGIFEAKKLGSTARRRRAFDQAFHICVMALNYQHSDFSPIPIESLCRVPSSAQGIALENLRKMLKAFGSSGENFQVPQSGRRMTTLASLLADLSDFATWEGLGGGGVYSRAFQGAEEGFVVGEVPRDMTRAEELQPYRSLDPARLKLFGTASWNPESYLSDMLWLAFVEPDSLLWTATEQADDRPDVGRESYDKVKELALLWDVNGLLSFGSAGDERFDASHAMRFFNNYKNIDIDRMIGDRRARNYVEGRLTAVSAGLPSAQSFMDLEIKLPQQRLSICCSDRKDFYHQICVTPPRAASNGLWPLLEINDVAGTDAFRAWLLREGSKKRYDRLIHGDFLKSGGKKPVLATGGGFLQACFASVPQGDHLGVEVATEGHRNFLRTWGLLGRDEELRAGNPFRGHDLATGLVIDDFYAISIEEADLPAHIPGEGLSKDRKLGLTTVAAPAQKRLALAFISLVVDYRCVAEELVLLAVLCPFFATDLSVEVQPRCFCTDSSDSKGAIVSCSLEEDWARVLVRTGRRKATYTRMLNRHEAILKKIDPDFEETGGFNEETAVERPRAFRFHFIEICGGAGKVAAALSAKGWTVGPVLDIDRSPHYDLASLRLLQWIFFMLEDGRLDSFMVEPPCTTFSPAQYPPSRSYDLPRGFDPQEPKTLQGTTLALRALSLMSLAAQLAIPGLLEQPRRSKMKKLEEWQRLLEFGWAHEVWTASCMYGSPHRKEFVFLLVAMQAEQLHRKCDGCHEHIPIQGQWTKPSATYTDELAEALAEAFHQALNDRLRSEKDRDLQVDGLENILVNDVILSRTWDLEQVWRWQKPAHINIQETMAAERLFKQEAVLRPKTRFPLIMDSNVSLSALVKGRTLRRFASNWLRLFLLLLETVPPWINDKDAWRYGHVNFRRTKLTRYEPKVVTTLNCRKAGLCCRLPQKTKDKISKGIAIFDWILEQCVGWRQAAIPDAAWPVLAFEAAKALELNEMGQAGSDELKKLGGEGAKHDETSKQELAQRKVLQAAASRTGKGRKGRGGEGTITANQCASKAIEVEPQPASDAAGERRHVGIFQPTSGPAIGSGLQERIRKMKEQEDAYKKQARTGEEAQWTRIWGELWCFMGRPEAL